MRQKNFRKHIAILLSVFMIFSAFSGSFAFANTPSAKSAEKTISSAADFPAEISTGETYVLAKDIDLSEGNVKQISNLAGTLDGKGHTVTLDGKALADNVSGTIRNLGVTTKSGEKVSSDKANGSIAMTLSGTIQSCFSTAYVYHTGWFTPGGLVGKLESTGYILNSWFAGTVVDNMELPGNGIVLGRSDNIRNCVATNGDAPLGKNCKKVKLEELNQDDTIALLNTEMDSESGLIWEKSEGTYPVLKGGKVVVDKSKLESLIKEAETKKSADYEEASWKTFEKALADAKKVNADADAKAKDVMAAESALSDAMSKLEKKAITETVKLPADAKEIASADDLEKIGDDPKYPTNGAYKLTADIKITKANMFIGFVDFDGIFDGQGHTVTFENGNPMFNSIKKNGVVQNLHLTGTLTSGGAIARNRLYGTIVNCYTDVSSSNGSGFAARLDGGSLANCYSASDAKDGPLFKAYEEKGTMTNVYWVNNLKNPEIPDTVKQKNVKAMTEEAMQTKDFVKLLNDNSGKYASKWGQSAKTGYPYFGEDQDYNPEATPLPIEKNKYQVVFTPEFGDKFEVEDQRIDLSPDEVSVPGNIAGSFSLKGVPEGKKVEWSYQEVKPAGSIMVGADQGDIRIDSAGRAIVTASIDGEIVAAVRVNATAKKIEEIKLLIDGKDVTNGTLKVAGSEMKSIKVQARYEGEKTFRDVSSNRFTYVAADRNLVDYVSTSNEFSFRQPGTDTITVTSISDTSKKATVKVTSSYVAVKSVKQTIGAKQVIHGINANSYDKKAYNPIYAGVVVLPENASNKRDYTITSSDPKVANFTSSMVNGYVPYRAGKTTFTVLLNDKDPYTEKINVVTSSTDVTFTYENPITKIEVPENIEMESFSEKALDIKFTGEKSNYSVSDTEMEWSYSKDGIVKIVAKPDSGQFFSIWKKGDAFSESDADYGMAVTTPYFNIKSMKEGTVTVTGTPVDQTKGLKPVKFTVTVKGGQAPAVDTDALVKQGLASANVYLSSAVNKGLAYDSEWVVFTQLRAGKNLTDAEKEAYYASASDRVKKWSAAQKPTDIERVALAMSILGYDITDIEGVNLAEMIYNHPNLQSGSNELAYALLALDARNTEVPKDARFTRETMVSELLSFQNKDGGFALNKEASGSSVDMTAMVLQALAPYTGDKKVEEAVNKAVYYLKSKQNSDHGYVNAESDAQVLLALTSLGIDPLDENNGFCNSYSNLITSLMKYHIDGQGFVHTIGGNVNAMASIQAAQALESYSRFKAGKNIYWNLSDMNFDAATVKTELPATADGKDKAAAELSEKDASELAASAASKKAKKAVIDVTGAKGTETEITIPASLIEKLNKETAAELEIDRNDVSLHFDRSLLANLEGAVKNKLRIRLVEDALTAEQKEILAGVGLDEKAVKGYRVELYADNAKDPMGDISPEALSVEIPVSSDLTKPAAVSFDSDNRVSLLNGFVFGDDSDRYMVKTSKAETFAVIEKEQADTLIKNQGTEKPGKKITVKFSLYGDSCHGDDGTVHTMAAGNLTKWIGEKEVTVTEGSTVKDVLETALNGSGYEATYRFNGSYVSAITTPDGDVLEEFGNGINSGWKYAVNGKYPDLSLDTQVVSENDVIIWHYTDDYTQEKEPVVAPVEKPGETDKPVTPPEGGDNTGGDNSGGNAGTDNSGNAGSNTGSNGSQNNQKPSNGNAAQTGDSTDMKLPVLLIAVCGLGAIALRRKNNA